MMGKNQQEEISKGYGGRLATLNEKPRRDKIWNTPELQNVHVPYAENDSLGVIVGSLSAYSMLPFQRHPEFLGHFVVPWKEELPGSEVVRELSQSACEQIRDLIRCACEHEAGNAISAIAQIWEQLVRAEQFAEARMRLCLAKVDEPALVDCPSWLMEPVKELSSSEDGLSASHPLAIESAEKLIRLVYTRNSQWQSLPEVEKAPLGQVAVTWETNRRRVTWLVAPSRLPWPGIEVKSTLMEMQGAQPHVEARVFFVASEAVEYLEKCLANGR
jgi:hypothetical protein